MKGIEEVVFIRTFKCKKMLTFLSETRNMDLCAQLAVDKDSWELAAEFYKPFQQFVLMCFNVQFVLMCLEFVIINWNWNKYTFRHSVAST